MKRIALPLVVLILFTTFSMWVALDQGYFGFLGLAGREPWGLQLLLDVAIACSLFSIWMVRDARQRGLPATPYLLGLLFLGSISALAYLVHRGLVASRAPAGVVAARA